MRQFGGPATERTSWLRNCVVILAAAIIAVISARSTVGGWNDGSRLATVESLVDYGTWAIDDSVFLKSTPTSMGTKDKLLIDGRYYSDKSPAPAVLMAVEYAVLKSITGWTAATDRDRFCEAFCLATAGLAYVFAVWSIDRLGRKVGLPTWTGLALTASFALATVAPVYARQVNNHILLLAVATGLLVELLDLRVTGRLFIAGSLAGLAYTIDLGAGPVIAIGAAALVFYRRRWAGLLSFAAAALPWVMLHHTLNYAIGGTIGPANANLEYLRWPGSPFTAANATGGWAHASLVQFFWYAVSLLVGLKGFLIHNPVLLLAVPMAVRLILRHVKEAPELMMASGWAIGTWLLYAAASTNSSGLSCSIRWFVPLLAPGYFVLAIMLQELPRLRRDFGVLSLWGAALVPVMWRQGPWMPHLVPYWWAFLAGGLIAWATMRWRYRELSPSHSQSDVKKPLAA